MKQRTGAGSGPRAHSLEKMLRDKQKEAGNELSIFEEKHEPYRPLVQTFLFYLPH